MNTKQRIEDVFQDGKRYTVFSIGGLAMTHCQRLTVKETNNKGEVVFQPKGKRSLYLLKLYSKAYESSPVKVSEAAVFEGWEHPYSADTEDFQGGVVKGNALLNFRDGDVPGIRAWFERYQLNPNCRLEIVAAQDPTDSDRETMVFPELYQGGHAVIDRVLSSAESSPT